MLRQENLDGLVVWSLVRAARVAARRFETVLKPFGLTPQQFGVLAQLDVQGQQTQAAIARAVLVRPQSAEALLTPLVERGLVARIGERGRGRPNPFMLTPEGARLLSRVWEPSAAVSELTWAGFDAAESEQLNVCLQHILDSDRTALNRTGVPGDLSV